MYDRATTSWFIQNIIALTWLGLGNLLLYIAIHTTQYIASVVCYTLPVQVTSEVSEAVAKPSEGTLPHPNQYNCVTASLVSILISRFKIGSLLRILDLDPRLWSSISSSVLFFGLKPLSLVFIFSLSIKFSTRVAETPHICIKINPQTMNTAPSSRGYCWPWHWGAGHQTLTS